MTTKISKVSYKKYKCSECGHVKDIQTNHYGECYGQAMLKMNMCPNCSWKHPLTNIVWTCQETERACNCYGSHESDCAKRPILN